MKPTNTSKRAWIPLSSPLVEEAGYVQGDPQDYGREHAVDLTKPLQFLSRHVARNL